MFSKIIITLIAILNIQLMEIECLPGVDKLYEDKGNVISLAPSNNNELKVSNLLESNLVRDIIDHSHSRAGDRGRDEEDGDKSKSSLRQQHNNPVTSATSAAEAEGIHFHSTKDKQDLFRKLT